MQSRHAEPVFDRGHRALQAGRHDSVVTLAVGHDPKTSCIDPEVSSIRKFERSATTDMPASNSVQSDTETIRRLSSLAADSFVTCRRYR